MLNTIVGAGAVGAGAVGAGAVGAGAVGARATLRYSTDSDQMMRIRLRNTAYHNPKFVIFWIIRFRGGAIGAVSCCGSCSIKSVLRSCSHKEPHHLVGVRAVTLCYSGCDSDGSGDSDNSIKHEK
jgi:hypothetical protein